MPRPDSQTAGGYVLLAALLMAAAAVLVIVFANGRGAPGLEDSALGFDGLVAWLSERGIEARSFAGGDSLTRDIGDIIADTLVIHQPVKILVPDLAAVAARQPRSERFGFLPAQLDHYGAFELQVLESVLQRRTSISDPAQKMQSETNLATIADRIRTKISYTDRVDPDETEAFLRAFYFAQRAHLERRQLYGDVRADKFHREAKAEPE